MTPGVVSLRPQQSAMMLERRYMAAVSDLQRAYPEQCWDRLRTVLESYGALCVELGRSGGRDPGAADA